MASPLRCRTLALLSVLMLTSVVQAQEQVVDHRYPPPRWFSAIGFIDDWQKSLVNEQGDLAYDFGPGPYTRPGTTIRIRTTAQSLVPAHQYLKNPRIPIVTTHFQADTFSSEQDAFALQWPLAEGVRENPAYRRLGGQTGAMAWATPEGRTDPALRSVAWGTGREIQYQVAVSPGARRRVVLGFCDSYRKLGGATRLMALHVEGATPQTIDLMELGGQHEPHARFFDAEDTDNDGWLDVTVAAAPQTQDPNVLLNAIWVFGPDVEVTEEAVLQGAATSLAETYVNCGDELYRQAFTRRADVLQARFSGQRVTPVVEVHSARPFTFDAEAGVLRTRGHPYLAVSPRPVAAEQTATGWVLALPAGTAHVTALVVHNPTDSVFTWPDVAAARAQTTSYWHTADLPWDRLQIPDSSLQAVLGAGVRTMYQVREVVDGLPQFQPGPTVYRGLWLHDNLSLANAALLLGDTTAARLDAELLLRHQGDDGRFVVMSPAMLLRETGLALWTIWQYARLADNKAWLRSRWIHFEEAVAWIQRVWDQASENPDAVYAGLMPPGLTDGGIGGINPEYSSTYWNLIGLRSAVEAARWLGESDTALDWEAEYIEFQAAFRRALDRDVQRDEEGFRYLPMRMGATQDIPHRGQKSFLQAVYPGQLFEVDDPFAREMVRVFDAPRIEGLVPSTGWVDDGLFFHIAPDYALAYLWQGHREEAQDILYATANHSSPALTWVEEHYPQGKGARIFGDTPNATTGAQVLRLVRHLLVCAST